ncbi:MAG: hybrid sensor histidine kinase/response regulator, partial [Phyllobacteriaceae bacterium]|nr:hybrid sensor histidine kinase/response regulator [Phyllobacteriaceae bacterium]
MTIGELRATVANYLGAEATGTAFEHYLRTHPQGARNDHLADAEMVRFAEQLLGRAVGSASARLVLSLLVERRNIKSPKTLQLLGEASQALQHNRGQLQTALDQVAQGICILDADFRLAFWNQRLFDLLSLPESLQLVGLPLRDLRDQLIRNGFLTPREANAFMANISRPGAILRLRAVSDGQVIEVQTSSLPGEGVVATFTDVTQTVRNAELLTRANEELENRVERRTAELMEANHELARSRMRADQANAGKTRFLAAAGHDILQPLNAARLYCASLMEDHGAGAHHPTLAHIDAALGSVESILGAVLEISKLDAGAMKTRIAPFPVASLLDSIRSDFAPAAREKGLKLTVLHSSLGISSDRDLLRRLIQNLVSNAIKYTPKGKVLVGVRRRGDQVMIEVHDSGIGMSEDDQQKAFQEFTRLDAGARQSAGLGLGLSIVERIAGVLGVQVELASRRPRHAYHSQRAMAQVQVRAEPTRCRYAVRRGARSMGLWCCALTMKP